MKKLILSAMSIMLALAITPLTALAQPAAAPESVTYDAQSAMEFLKAL